MRIHISQAYKCLLVVYHKRIELNPMYEHTNLFVSNRQMNYNRPNSPVIYSPQLIAQSLQPIPDYSSVGWKTRHSSEIMALICMDCGPVASVEIEFDRIIIYLSDP